MLLDRKRINFWARWTAIFLAIVFALGTVLLGVGSTTGNVFAGCAGQETVRDDGYTSAETELKDRLAQNPADTATMRELALYYDKSGQYPSAVQYYDEYLKLVPGDPQVMELKMVASFNAGRAQMVAGDYAQGAAGLQATIDIANQLVALNPANANAYKYQGYAARDLGQTETALAAFNRFLEIAPNDPWVGTVRDEIARLSAPPATTVPASPAQ